MRADEAKPRSSMDRFKQRGAVHPLPAAYTERSDPRVRPKSIVHTLT